MKLPGRTLSAQFSAWAKSIRLKKRSSGSSVPAAEPENREFKLHTYALEARVLLDAAAPAGVAEAAVAEVAQEQATLAQNTGTENSSGDASDLPDLIEALTEQGSATDRREIVFIDSTVEDLSSLLSELSDSVEIIVLDPERDGVEQIAEVLSNRTDIDAIHILSHGEEGRINLGNDVLSIESMQGEHADELSVIREALSATGDILIYGCDLAGNAEGELFVSTLAALTGADVAASTDDTGAAEHGGNWDLEHQIGQVDTPAVQALAFDGLLADTDGDGVDDANDLDDDNDGILDTDEDGPISPEPVLGVQDTAVNWIDFRFNTLIGGTYDTNTSGFGVIGTFDLGNLSPSLAGITATLTLTTTEPGVSRVFLGAASGTFSNGQAQLEITFSAPVDFRREQSAGVAFGGGEIEVHTSDVGIHFSSAGAGINHVPDTGAGVATFDAIGIPAAIAPVFAETYGTTAYTFSWDDNEGLALTQNFRLEIGELPRASSEGADTDGDGIPNRTDLDSDNDGISDLTESGQNASIVDTDGDGVHDGPVDPITGIPLAANAGAGVTPIDSDSDGLENYLDLYWC